MNETINNLIKKSLPYLIIIGLCIVLFFQRSCHTTNNVSHDTPTVNVNGSNYNLIKHVHDTIYVPEAPQIVYKPGKTIYQDTPIYVPVPVDVDTASILKEYYTKRIYTDTLRLNDSVGYVAVRDSIFKNTILNRKFDAHINKIKITDTYYISPVKRTQWYIGGLIGAYKPNTAMVGGSLFIKNREDQIYGINVGTTSNLTPFVQGTMLWKIHIKK